MKRFATFTLSSALALGACAVPGARAADEPEGWAVKVTPYLWATRMHGSTQIRELPEAKLDMSFSDILDTLDAGFMGAVEFQHGRWGILIDSMYMKTSDSISVAGPGRSRADADVRISQTMLTGALAYRWLDSAATSDGFVGVRYMRIHETLDLDASVLGTTANLDHEQSVDWTEPFIGLRGRVPLSTNLAMVASGDVGGFGLGSDLTTQALLGLSYALSDAFDAELGFRYMKVDYDKGNLVYDMENEGPYLGMSYHF
ncbi:hypothetical protein D3C78_316460 [compost metagenome]